jgi:hypothetical protein
MTVRVQYGNNSNVEMFDIVMAKQITNANVSYSISNRLKTNDLAVDTIATVDLDVDNKLIVILTTGLIRTSLIA